jgi:hypothetical protein
MAKFRVINTFEIPARDYFVLCGDVVEGMVAAGMLVHVPMNAALNTAILIDSVEVVSGTRGSNVGLCVRGDERDRAFLRGLNMQDEIFEVAGPITSSSPAPPRTDPGTA